jgi:hypothetical protein
MKSYSESSSSASFNSDNNLSDECNSQCETPCVNVKHFECNMLGEIIQKAFEENNVASNKTDTILNRLFTPHKPKSKIRMFMKAEKNNKKE